MKTVRSARVAALVATLASGAASLGVPNPCVAQVTPRSTNPRLTQRELDDPLEPVSLEPSGSLSLPPVIQPAVPPTGALPDTARTSSRFGPSPARPPSANDAERVLVVTCRQLLVDDPRLAARLARLLHAGANLDDAKRALGKTDLETHTREYAIDELAGDVRAEVERLSEGSWSDVRPWRGRSLLFQVVAKEERTRGSIPHLGAGLAPEEQERLAQRQQMQSQPQRQAGNDPAQDYQQASVVQQEQPEYPVGIVEPGEVVVMVEVQIGLTDDPVSTHVISSTNHQFDQSAVGAAQHSKYRSARRHGIPEAGTVTLTFKFVAPGQQGQPPNQPGDPPRHD